ncbi:hypothetical protein [Geothermobacter hydrogeniphilus]|uniref:Uncharacterized protein n=1 Tax=Geothermobacter hydrogeniphilus TaxID=1969733 RepID=A0A1X0XXQ0_9BACT|nr:hypothetical protein [Geothermobacter hydrogeniphilus]ORJ57568.1 hypothetical protein B5V00_13200 [Geothermobacter hydrogeniphilus]
MDWNIVQLVLWLIAGIVSFYFSIGNARVWTSIAVGFGLILLGELLPQAMPFLPGASSPQIEAMSYILGTISILVMSHGFQEYYVFSRTLELEGNKLLVYVATLGVIFASMIFILINPDPTPSTLKVIRVVEDTNWVFLSLINIDLIRKIYINVKDSPISKGFIAFMLVFIFIFLWRGSELYIQVYDLANPDVSRLFPFRYELSQICSNVGNLLAGLSVAGTFIYLARLLR